MSITNALRCSGYWVLSNSTNIRRIIHRCIQCRRFRGKLGEQKMANLPPERITTTAPFTHCGVDMFGPFNVKEKRAERKRFVALFTCFSSRAIHLEVTSNMDTDSFILALRRFLARRGAVASIRSDNGTNFVGAANQFKQAYREMDHERINNFLVSGSCNWIIWERNHPHASHIGEV